MTGLVIFRDESGTEATYTFATDGDESGDLWVNICDRAQKRLGLVESDAQRLAWPGVAKRAKERAK